MIISNNYLLFKLCPKGNPVLDAVLTTITVLSIAKDVYDYFNGKENYIRL